MNSVRSVRSRIHELIDEAWAQATDSGALPVVEAEARPDFEIERPTNPDHGDLAANLAMKLARPMRRSPLQIAEVLAEAMRKAASSEALSEVTVAPPGFLNMRLSATWLEGVLDEAQAAGDAFGRVVQDTPRHYNVEFVSANPTGPLHIGHGRQAALGDAISALLEWTGWKVHREFYYNDAGAQIERLAQSVRARYLEYFGHESKIPEGGYQGDYVRRIAEELAAQVGDGLVEDTSEEALSRIREFAVRDLRAVQDRDLFGVGPGTGAVLRFPGNLFGTSPCTSHLAQRLLGNLPGIVRRA